MKMISSASSETLSPPQLIWRMRGIFLMWIKWNLIEILKEWRPSMGSASAWHSRQLHPIPNPTPSWQSQSNPFNPEAPNPTSRHHTPNRPKTRASVSAIYWIRHSKRLSNIINLRKGCWWRGRLRTAYRLLRSSLVEQSPPSSQSWTGPLKANSICSSNLTCSQIVCQSSFWVVRRYRIRSNSPESSWPPATSSPPSPSLLLAASPPTT